MNEKLFKQAMLRGQGRCVLACKEEPEKYRRAIMWGCTHQIAYDAQCQGTGAWYLHELVSCYPEAEPFRDAAVSMLFGKNMPIWLQLQAEEFLHYLADDGDEIAKRALWDKYTQMNSELMAKKRRPNGYFRLVDDYVFLAIDLICEEDNSFRICSDMGRLISENPIYDARDFGSFFWHIRDQKQMTALKSYAKRDGYAALFLAESVKAEKEDKEAFKERDAQNKRLPQTNKEEAFRSCAERYVNESDPEKRADLLQVFVFRSVFPLEPDPVIKDASSGNERLSDTAWRALRHIRSPKVQAFAHSNLDAVPEKLIPLLITNYSEEDRPLLEILLEKSRTDKDADDIIHSIGFCVNDQRDIGLKAPAWLLRWFYENDRCSFCREELVREMGRRRLLTDEILKECLYDSNEDIRKYASKRLEKQNYKLKGTQS